MIDLALPIGDDKWQPEAAKSKKKSAQVNS
jgi:hypothetical protein